MTPGTKTVKRLIEIELSPANEPIDEPLHGLVHGLLPGESVSVGAQLIDAQGVTWSSREAQRGGDASRHVHYADAGHLMRPPGVSTSVLDGKFALGGTPQGQAAANRAAWLETVTFLRQSLGCHLYSPR